MEWRPGDGVGRVGFVWGRDTFKIEDVDDVDRGCGARWSSVMEADLLDFSW